MCDTSLAHPGKQVPDGFRGPSRHRPAPDRAALTRGNEESTKVIGTPFSVKVTYPQFGPVVDLAYTRCRATW